FDSSDPRRCLNALHLIEQLRLTDALSILQTCLNHEVEQIRIRAQEILPVFQDEIPQARELSLRQRKESKEPLQESAEVQSPRELLKQLVASLRNSDIRETTALLQELAKERENPETAAFLRKLLTNPSLGLDPFILATAVKTLAVCSDQSEYETLSRYLNHADGRVISNTVEALAARDEPSLLPFLEKHLEIMEITDPIQVRVLSSGLEFLRTKKEDLALEAMRKLASGDINSITTFLLHLEKWPDPHQEFQDLVFQILEGEVRLEVTRSCIRHLEVHGDPICVNLLKNLISDLLEGEKRSLLKDLYYFMIEKFGLTAESLPEDHPAQIEPEIKLDETSLQPEKGSPKTVISGLQQRAAMFLNLSTEPSKRALILQIPLGGEKKHKLEIPTKVVKWAGISLGVVFLVGTGSLFLLSSDSSMKNLRGGRNDTSKPVVSKRSSGGTNIKGRGTIQMIDLADGTVRTQGENGEFDVQFENPALLDRFSRGQKVKFVGEFLEKYPADVVQVKGKFLFEDRRLGKKKKS
ncbi:HEAT repeat domain-containing protein, partial [bacterium]|nr:HEAT repeat domain-containing protein [bacterium]